MALKNRLKVVNTMLVSKDKILKSQKSRKWVEHDNWLSMVGLIAFVDEDLVVTNVNLLSKDKRFKEKKTRKEIVSQQESRMLELEVRMYKRHRINITPSIICSSL